MGVCFRVQSNGIFKIVRPEYADISPDHCVISDAYDWTINQISFGYLVGIEDFRDFDSRLDNDLKSEK